MLDYLTNAWPINHILILTYQLFFHLNLPIKINIEFRIKRKILKPHCSKFCDFSKSSVSLRELQSPTKKPIYLELRNTMYCFCPCYNLFPLFSPTILRVLFKSNPLKFIRLSYQALEKDFIMRIKQAGAELCQAQAQVSFPAEADLHLTVEFQIWVLLEKTFNYI